MSPEWPSIKGWKGPGASECQEVGVPGPLYFARKNDHPSRYQVLEDDRRRRITQGGRGRDKTETEGPTMDDPPGDNRDLGAGQGRKGGETDGGRGGRSRHAAQVAESIGVGWQVTGVG